MRGLSLGMVVTMMTATAVSFAQIEIFSDGFESGDSCSWSVTFPDGCQICELGEFNCSGNAILECDAGPPAQWVPTGTVCDPTALNHCNAQTGTCDPLQVIGTVLPTTGVTTSYIAGEPMISQSFLGFGDVEGVFFSGNEHGRIVYSVDPAVEDWVAEFEFPNMAGSHFDGLEVVVDPNTGIQYVYASDMTSDYLGQYRRDPILGWIQENSFGYADTGDYVEGMGFGALNHFWYTGSGNQIYEIGGGDLTAYLE